MFRFSDYSEYRRHEEDLARRVERHRVEQEIREARESARDDARGRARRSPRISTARARWA